MNVVYDSKRVKKFKKNFFQHFKYKLVDRSLHRILPLRRLCFVRRFSVCLFVISNTDQSLWKLYQIRVCLDKEELTKFWKKSAAQTAPEFAPPTFEMLPAPLPISHGRQA